MHCAFSVGGSCLYPTTHCAHKQEMHTYSTVLIVHRLWEAHVYNPALKQVAQH